jgi:hypothetical protein
MGGAAGAARCLVRSALVRVLCVRKETGMRKEKKKKMKEKKRKNMEKISNLKISEK